MTTADELRLAATHLDAAATRLSQLAFHSVAEHLAEAARGLRIAALDPALQFELEPAAPVLEVVQARSDA